MKDSARKELFLAALWAAGMMGVSLLSAYAFRRGYIDADVKARMIAINGLWIMWYGNRVPKAFVPNRCARQFKRFVGWSMVLSGLVYAGLFAFAPLTTALTVGTAAVLTGMLSSLGYCLWLATAKTRAV